MNLKTLAELLYIFVNTVVSPKNSQVASTNESSVTKRQRQKTTRRIANVRVALYGDVALSPCRYLRHFRHSLLATYVLLDIRI